MTTIEQFEYEINNIPTNILSIAREDSKNTDSAGVVLNKTKVVVDFAINFTKKIQLSNLDPTQKLDLINKLNSAIYPSEFSADGRLNKKTGLGLLFQNALNN